MQPHVLPTLWLCYVAVTVYCGVKDLITNRIPNWLVAALMFWFFPYAQLVHWNIGAHFAVMGVATAFGFALFLSGCLGGGAAKFAAVQALWLGPDKCIVFFIPLIALGALALFVIKVVQNREYSFDSGSQSVPGPIMKRVYLRGVPFGPIIVMCSFMAWWSTFPALQISSIIP